MTNKIQPAAPMPLRASVLGQSSAAAGEVLIMTKTCFKCHRVLPIGEFYKHPLMGDGHLGKCKDCTKRDVRERYVLTRPERAEYEQKRCRRPERKRQILEYARKRRAAHPEKTRAYIALQRAIRSGNLVRQPCEVCGEVKVQAHHDDYLKPLDVRWLCFKHHREVHGQVVTSSYK